MMIKEVTDETLHAAIELLQKNNLPTVDISLKTYLYTLYNERELIGTVGLEYFEENALFRSLCVDEAKRSKGAGNMLLTFAEQKAKEKGANEMYLLTTTAEHYFLQKGFQNIDRNDVPEAIKRSSEFSSVCPASAVIMKKDLV